MRLCVLQEPNTGLCFNDVLELDTSTWTWEQLQVTVQLLAQTTITTDVDTGYRAACLHVTTVEKVLCVRCSLCGPPTGVDATQAYQFQAVLKLLR